MGSEERRGDDAATGEEGGEVEVFKTAGIVSLADCAITMRFPTGGGVTARLGGMRGCIQLRQVKGILRAAR